MAHEKTTAAKLSISMQKEYVNSKREGCVSWVHSATNHDASSRKCAYHFVKSVSATIITSERVNTNTVLWEVQRFSVCHWDMLTTAKWLLPKCTSKSCSTRNFATTIKYCKSSSDHNNLQLEVACEKHYLQVVTVSLKSRASVEWWGGNGKGKEEERSRGEVG